MSEFLNMKEYETQRKTIPVVLTYCANIYEAMGNQAKAITIREIRKQVVEGETVNMTFIGTLSKSFIDDQYLEQNYKKMGLEQLLPLEAAKLVAETMVALWYVKE